jgi:hypothetical protein
MVITEHPAHTDTFHTTSDFWDCNCDMAYIHSALESECAMCHAQKEDQPDSRIEEIEHMMRGEVFYLGSWRKKSDVLVSKL